MDAIVWMASLHVEIECPLGTTFGLFCAWLIGFINSCGNIISESVSRTALHRKSETDNTIILDNFHYYFMRNVLCIFNIKISTCKVYHKLYSGRHTMQYVKKMLFFCMHRIARWYCILKKMCTNILNAEINTNAKHLLQFSIFSVAIKL